MSVIIYTYRDPYKLKENKELWKEISSCPYFCAAQTLVNGLKVVYGAAFQIGRVTTVKNLTDVLYEKWNGTACAVKQHADIDNIIVNSSDITGISRIELDNVKKSFLFNRDEVFTSIRTMFELKMEPQNIVDKYLTPEQRFIVSVYKKIRASEKVKDFCLEQDFTEEQINKAIIKAMTTAKDNSSTKNEIEVETLDHIVIHGVHQFSPLLLRAIEEIAKYKKVPKIVELATTMRDAIRKEQNFDAAGFIYRPMYAELRKLIEYYSQNENVLFASTMSNWASLAGFRGSEKKNGEITYSATSFSAKAAINSQLIPPRWDEYLNTAQNQFLMNVQNAYDKSMARKTQDRAIRGTFSRKLAIENDYLHFFAPGDEVFDCIVDNAINSCKGCSSAFATFCRINWIGLIFTWSIAPDTSYLLDNGVSIYAMSPYRNYLFSEQVIIPVSISNVDELDDETIIREYTEIINRGFNAKSNLVHLGKRSHEARFLKDTIKGRNIDWFKEKFGGENWEDYVLSARKYSHEKALEILKKRSNIRGAREEMERTLSARVANSEFYGLNDEGIEQLKQTQKIVLDAIKHPKIHLESVSFIMMIGERNE